MLKQLDFAITLLQKLHLEGVSSKEIASDLNAAGFVTMQGKPFTRGNVLNILYRQSHAALGRYAVAFNRITGSTPCLSA